MLSKKKVLIGGSRSIYDPRELIIAFKIVYHDGTFLKDRKEIGTVISGGARGVDKMGETFASRNAISLIICPANWQRESSRNSVSEADCGVLLWDGISHGTLMLIEEFTLQNKPFYVHYAVPTASYKNKDIEDFLKENKNA